jgi:hypothetical protein
MQTVGSTQPRTQDLFDRRRDPGNEVGGHYVLRPISTQGNFPRTENFPKISLLKVENFQPFHFF